MADAIQRKYQLLELMASMSATFINLPLDLVDSALNEYLGRMAGCVGADRAYIFDYDLRRRICRNTHE